VVKPSDAEKFALIRSVRLALQMDPKLIEKWSDIKLKVQSSCKKCFGRGYTGTNITHGHTPVICTCMQIHIDWKEDKVASTS